MVRTRNSGRKSTKSPIKKKLTPKIATTEIDHRKIERCKQWLTQQKREKGKIQSQPIDALESDASADEDELCVLRLNEAALVSVAVWHTRVSGRLKYIEFNFVPLCAASTASECEKTRNIFRMRMAEVQ